MSATPAGKSRIYIIGEDPSVDCIQILDKNGVPIVWMDSDGTVNFGNANVGGIVAPGFILNSDGKFTEYDGLPLKNSGVPSQIAFFDALNQGAAISNQVLYTPVTTDATGAGEFYAAFFEAKVVQAASSGSMLGSTSGITYSFLAEDGHAVSSIPAVLNGNVSHNDLTTTVASGMFTMYATPGTPITISFGYSSTGTTPMLYNLHIRLFRL
jgi:hypothetical protein